MRRVNWILVAAAGSLCAQPALSAPKAEADATAPPASSCDPMPYTVQRADEAIGLQLKVVGLKPAANTDKPPLIDGQVDYEDLHARAAGAMQTAVSEVARVEFCRLAEAYPAKADELSAAETDFEEELGTIFDAANYKTLAARKALITEIKGRCKGPGAACKDVPTVLTQAEFNAKWKHENFTSYNFKSLSAGAKIMNIADAKGCRAYVDATLAQVPGVYLSILENTGPVIRDYLAGGQRQVAGLVRVVGYGQVIYAADDKGVKDVRTAAQDAKIGSCLTAVAQAAPDTPADGKKTAKVDTKEGKPPTPANPETKPQPASDPKPAQPSSGSKNP